ncbi:MAG: hypothetical protein M3Y29_01455 [Chloroflexota bacterium]|nr:hypothetical protein [Chloroflexota bacterium]
MKRLSSWALPVILGVAGLALIIVGSLDLEADPTSSLAPIATPPGVAAPPATPEPTPTRASESPGESRTPEPTNEPTAEPTPTPLPDDVVAVRLEVPSVGINVAVFPPANTEQCAFPPSNGAYLLCRTDADGTLLPSYQPGHNVGSYVFAHALNSLFKPLWNVQIGAEVLVRMSNEQVLRYVVTEVRPNVPCPDDSATTNNPEDFGIEPPLALQIHDDCDEGSFWTAPTDYERLTLQTSQGYNRNWGELVIVAEPAA